MNDQDNVLIIKNSEGYKVEIKSGKHTLISDESKESGGSDDGPNPYELLLSALGSCKAITMRMYAIRKNFPLTEITIKLKIDKIYAKDCEGCETKEGKIDKIDVEINLSGDLNDEQKKRLLEISGKCPVHKTLTSEVKIYTSIAIQL